MARQMERDVNEARYQGDLLGVDARHAVRQGETRLEEIGDDLEQELPPGMRKTVRDVRRNLEGASPQSQQPLGNALHRVEHRVEERPLGSIIAALGAGMAIGYMLHRR